MRVCGHRTKDSPLVAGDIAYLLLKFPESYKKVLSEVVIHFNLHEKVSVSEISSAHTSCLTQQLSVHVDAGLTIKPERSSTTRNYIIAMNRADVNAHKFRKR